MLIPCDHCGCFGITDITVEPEYRVTITDTTDSGTR